MAVATNYCGRCGRPNPAGAPFCGNCGSPLGAAPAAAAPAPAAAPAQPWTYPVAPRAAVPSATSKLPFLLLAAALGLVLLLAVIVITTVAIFRFGGGNPQQPCLRNCGPKVGTRLPEPSSYRSTSFGYEVDYESDWKPQTQEGGNLVVSTTNGFGLLQVVGTKAGKPDAQAVADFVAALPSASWQGAHVVGDIKGAHIGHVNGSGALYEANFVTSNGRAIRVRFAVIAATHNGVSVVFFAADPADTQHSVSGIPEAGRFDYVLSEFRWAGQS